MPSEPGRTALIVAPNGGTRTKADHPALPLSAGELAGTAAECRGAGAAMMHLHVRRSDGRHMLDADAYRAAIAAIRAEVGDRMVVQISTEALGLYTPAEQVALVKATRPEAASLALRELAPDRASEPVFLELLAWMRREHVLPQIILYDPDEAGRLAGMAERGDIPWRDPPVLYVLGRYNASQTSSPSDLLPFLASDTPRFGNWSVCAFGRYEAACVTTAALFGGHVRVGFENNFLLPDGSRARSNAELVATVAGAARQLGLELCDADMVRELFSAEG
jgi:uncharacterized protein (DUF849 family)